MLTKAVKTATKLHDGQYRKHVGHSRTKLPFIVHPLEVMKIIWTWGVGEEILLTAAVCHDLIEDTNATKEKLAILFGEEVARLVEELTFHLPKTKRHKVQAKAEYIASFLNKSVEALIIKLADRFCNVRDFFVTDPEYAIEYYHKAEPLLRAWESREREVAERFGETVAYSIAAHHTDLVQLMRSSMLTQDDINTIIDQEDAAIPTSETPGKSHRLI